MKQLCHSSCTAPLLPVLVALALCTPVSAKDQRSDVVKEPVAQQILGWWELDAQKMEEDMLREAAKKNPGKELTKEEAAKIAANVKKRAGEVVLEFKPEGTVRAHQKREIEDASYKILQSNEATGAFTMELTPPEEDGNKATGRIDGDRLELTARKDKRAIYLRRLTNKRAEERLAALDKKRQEREKERQEREEQK